MGGAPFPVAGLAAFSLGKDNSPAHAGLFEEATRWRVDLPVFPYSGDRWHAPGFG
jgi:hypothetical protein